MRWEGRAWREAAGRFAQEGLASAVVVDVVAVPALMGIETAIKWGGVAGFCSQGLIEHDRE
jgi:hypothetical protein